MLFDGRTDAVVAFSPRGTWLAAGTLQGYLLWRSPGGDADAWAPARPLLSHEMIPRAVGVEYISEVRRVFEEHGPVLRAFSPALLIDAEDPPVFLKYEKAIESATSAKEAIHSSQFGVVMKALSDEAGHECHLQIAPSAEESRNWNAHWFLKQALLGKRGKK